MWETAKIAGYDRCLMPPYLLKVFHSLLIRTGGHADHIAAVTSERFLGGTAEHDSDSIGSKISSNGGPNSVKLARKACGDCHELPEQDIRNL